MSGLQLETDQTDRSDRIRELEARVAELEAEVEHLERAVQSRTTIGTAIGLLAERHGTTTPQAWSLLTTLSNHANSKVHEVARLMVAVADGDLETHEVAVVAQLARLLPRAAAAAGVLRPDRDAPGRRPAPVAGARPPSRVVPPVPDGGARP